MKQLFSKKLPIPDIPVYPGRQWFKIAGIYGFASQLRAEFKARNIPYYLPRTRIVGETGIVACGGPLFPGIMFVSLQAENKVQWINELVPRYILTKEKQGCLIADMRFMKLCERLNSKFRFQWEKSLPEAGIILHDNHGFGHLQIEYRSDAVKLYFSFFNGKKILSYSIPEREFLKLRK